MQHRSLTVIGENTICVSNPRESAGYPLVKRTYRGIRAGSENDELSLSGVSLSTLYDEVGLPQDRNSLEIRARDGRSICASTDIIKTGMVAFESTGEEKEKPFPPTTFPLVVIDGTDRDCWFKGVSCIESVQLQPGADRSVDQLLREDRSRVV